MPVFEYPSVRTGGYLGQSASLNIINSEIIVAAGQGILDAGTVLGQRTATGRFARYDPDALDGTEVATAILFSRVDATSADVRAVATDFGPVTVVLDRLNFKAGTSTAAKTKAASRLKSSGIAALPSGTQVKLIPPIGYVFLTDTDGAYLTDDDGAYLVAQI